MAMSKSVSGGMFDASEARQLFFCSFRFVGLSEHWPFVRSFDAFRDACMAFP